MVAGVIDFRDYRELEELDSDFLNTALEKLKQEKERRINIERNDGTARLEKLLDEVATLIKKYDFTVYCYSEYGDYLEFIIDNSISFQVD